MREIRFRAWDLYSKEMDHEVTIDSNGKVAAFSPLDGQYVRGFSDSEKVIMQYTGLKDKNGVEIYEGDIVRVNKLTFESSGPLPENLIVKYYGSMFQLFRGNENLMGLYLEYIEDGEVIGSIYTHPHLLGSEKE